MLDPLAVLRWLNLCALIGLMAVAHTAWAQSPAAATPIRVVDDRGRTVQLERPPQRIVSLLPSLTESVCQLGACDRLVGVDRYSNWPAQVLPLQTVGGGLDPQVEAVLALRPDVVLLAASTRLADRLESLGLRAVVLEPRTHADVQRTLLTLGALLGVDSAAALWLSVEQGMANAAAAVPAQARGVRIYFEASAGPYGASASSFIGQTLARLGVANVLPGELGPFPRVNPEFVVRADPDLIMIGSLGADTLAQRPGWAGLRALRQQRLCAFAPAQADMLVRPGPRMAEGASLMAACLSRHFGPTQGAAR